MAHSVSVIIPVKNGARHLREVLAAVAAQQLTAEVEVLLVDSGSTDATLDIARAAEVRLLEIEPSGFQHGRTRNFAAEQAEGECLVFLTQDAAPASDQWLSNLIAPLDAAQRIGLSFGPHLPRPDTSPMVARELDDFFGSFSPSGAVRIDSAIVTADPASGFFSNVNSAILRSCWDQVRFRDVEYAEDQAFARDAMAAGWKKAYAPAAGALHAHDYPYTKFMRRYFDEYRGLRETLGHVEPRSPVHIAKVTREQVSADRTYMKGHGYGGARRTSWTVRSAAHHGGRALFSALGSRAHRLPSRLRSVLSLEGRGDAPASASDRLRTRHVSPRSVVQAYEYTLTLHDEAPPLRSVPSAHDEPLSLAIVIPPFRRGSGGHMTIFTLVAELEALGHSCSIWVHDPDGEMQRKGIEPAPEINEHFVRLRAEIHRDLSNWRGADVAIATGWQTAYPVRMLSDCALKAYLVQDFEPDFYAASAERMWAEETYRMGIPCICASPWLRDVMRDRYEATAESFELGVDFGTYRDLGLRRDPATIAFYARRITPRRATEMGLLALSEVLDRRPGCRVVIFGDTKIPTARFDFDFAGVAPQPALARLYNEATMGLVLSLTNYSRVPKEMMGCGLPVVDLDHPSVISVFGEGSDAIALARPEAASIADRMLALLDDPIQRDAQARAARELVAGMTWKAAARDIERALRSWLSARVPANV